VAPVKTSFDTMRAMNSIATAFCITLVIMSCALPCTYGAGTCRTWRRSYPILCYYYSVFSFCSPKLMTNTTSSDDCV
jgi:hypothetical protein